MDRNSNYHWGATPEIMSIIGRRELTRQPETGGQEDRDCQAGNYADQTG